MGRILCVAEKPSIAKAVAEHLSGRQMRSQRVRGTQYISNHEFQYNFGHRWGNSHVVFTAVAGHLTSQDFTDQYRYWNSCRPQELFDAPIRTFVADDKKGIAQNIQDLARRCDGLFIWTDCDREGEHIGTEIREWARKGNRNIEVKRARFSNIERAHVLTAARNPIEIDERAAFAVAARIELDLRIGAAFTRMQTQTLGNMIGREGVISYGSCQFPTLGFVVDRYFRVKNFVPETFWNIKVMHVKEDIKVNFNWSRVHLFDRMAVTVLFERCLSAKQAKVTKMQKKPTSKWRPLPLTTVELQKMGSRYLRMDSQAVMKAAEQLYQHGWISYPRTETDQFDRGMDLRRIIEKQHQSRDWGNYAQMLTGGGGFRQPRNGRNNDQAHPPIHPVNFVEKTALQDDNQRRVYEFVVRRFLACCSEDAKGEATDIEILYGSETFRTHGLKVLERNYLEVYPYDKWESSQQLPDFAVGEVFEPTEANMGEGKTSPPGYLTEPELISLMDANGIGTDATMAEHIAKIKEREYVMTRPRSGGHGDAGGFETSLSKPFLRKQMEQQMRAICAGSTTKHDVVHQSLEQYREVYVRTTAQIHHLKNAMRKYVLNQQ
ncbi:dna topoisomerase iii [Neofusicoccum parvum]|uniref:DNA topoisomerase n=1 Tax=Botryosphaeria parva (strain UCR-NP2) TaxID=1287680 RepID=R1EAR5_BOTPV|nr:putative dna topoisomerase iii protein [Neofusicoccum parvum UCRNP2]GME53931.1 dna topoisomerase iii [Neofusicoccum parvum]